MRLDEFLFVNKYFDSRTKAKQAIERKEVFVNEKLIDKPSFNITNINAQIKIVSEVSFVSLGGYKLNHALKLFDLSVNNLICADVGSSTGGFTNCLLNNGAKKVYSIDLNDTLLHHTLKENDKVIQIIKNARYLMPEDFSEELDFISADLSFISETLVLPVFVNLLKENGKAIILIKPQFEIGVKRKNKNGIVKDNKERLLCIKNVYDCAISCGFYPLSLCAAPINKDKNVEYLMLLSKTADRIKSFDELINNVNFK